MKLLAGDNRASLYHRFKDNQALVLAVLDLVEETWNQDVAPLVDRESDPVAALFALAHGHAVFCRHDLARVTVALRLDFAAQDHPVARRLELISECLVQRCTHLITAGRRVGSIPAGPPARAVGLAFIGSIEGAVTELTAQAPHDEALAAGAAAGVLGLDLESDPIGNPTERHSMHPFRSALETGEPDAVLELVSPEVVFNSPVVFRPYHGREAIGVVLRAAGRTLDDFHFEREIGASGASDYALVFRARVGDRELHGCDFLHVGEDGLIDEFTVMVRPLSAALAFAEAMKTEVPAVQRELGLTVT